MKKIILLLSLYLVNTNTFSQNIIFQDNFEKGKLNPAWKFSNGPLWYVANLESKGIKPPPGGNNFALAGNFNMRNSGYMGHTDAKITIDIPVINNYSQVPLQLNFNYWVYSKGSKGIVSILFLKNSGDSINSVNFAELTEKLNWDLFNQKFIVPKETSVIRLTLGGRSASVGAGTVYFQSIYLGYNSSK